MHGEEEVEEVARAYGGLVRVRARAGVKVRVGARARVGARVGVGVRVRVRAHSGLLVERARLAIDLAQC